MVAHCQKRDKRVFELYVDLGTVERSITFIDLVRPCPCCFNAVSSALVARSQSSSVPMDFSGRVLSSIMYSKPKIAITSRTKLMMPRISSLS